MLWLIRLRWGAAVCQLAALAVAGSLFSLELSGTLLFGLVGVTAGTNVALELYNRSHRNSPPALIAGVLTFDTVLLTVLLMASGGATNPFSVLYLVNVTLAAVLLPLSWTWIVVGLSVGGFALLFVADGGHRGAMGHTGYGSHLQGMWIAYTTAAIVIAYFVGRLSSALRRRERELIEVRELAMRNERLAALTTLAAGAAHELNTPLSTVAVVAKEIQRKCDTLDPDLAEDAGLIRTELERCRGILEQMSAHAGESLGEAPEELEVDRLVKMLCDRLGEAAARLEVIRSGDRRTLFVTPQALARVLLNLVKNGLDASPSHTAVHLDIRGTDDRVVFVVEDHGTGMGEEVRSRVFEPFFTTKAPGKGFGLGLFLVKSFADRLGGSLELETAVDRGTKVTLALPQPQPSTRAAKERHDLDLAPGVAKG